MLIIYTLSGILTFESLPWVHFIYVVKYQRNLNDTNLAFKVFANLPTSKRCNSKSAGFIKLYCVFY